VPEVTILSQTPYAWVNKERKLVESTFVVYKDKAGHVGTIVIGKPKVIEADVEAELKKRQGGV